MTWGTDLWDQIDNVFIHTQKSLDFCEIIVQFYKERCGIERDYANKLTKLVKNISCKMKNDDEFTCQKSFLHSLRETNDIAGQHEILAEDFNNRIVKEMVQFVQEFKQQKKNLTQNASKQQSLFQNQMDKVDKAKKKYEKAFNEVEKTAKIYLENNIYTTACEANMRSKEQLSDSCKSEYAKEVQHANKALREHYEVQIPSMLKQLQVMDEIRTTKIKYIIDVSSKIEKDVMPIMQKCLDGIEKAATSINSTEDSRLVVEKYKTGFPLPKDIPFEDLENTTAASNRGSNSHIGKPKKTQEIFNPTPSQEPKEDFSHLPPIQREKQILRKIANLKDDLEIEIQKMDGLNKLHIAYVSKQRFGDSGKLDNDLSKVSNDIQRLEQEIQKFESFLSDFQSCNSSSEDDSCIIRKHANSLSSSLSSSPDTDTKSTATRDSSDRISFSWISTLSSSPTYNPIAALANIINNSCQRDKF